MKVLKRRLVQVNIKQFEEIYLYCPGKLNLEIIWVDEVWCPNLINPYNTLAQSSDLEILQPFLGYLDH